jgi:hypothetical protein
MRRSALVLAFLFASAPALAADRKACIAAADEGQKLRDDSKLTDAREKFLVCADKGCPSAVSKQCLEWVSEIDHDMPTIAFRAKDGAGKELFDVQVFVDDKSLAESIPPKAFSVDPGTHRVRFVRRDGTTVEDTVLVRTAEKDRIIELTFKPPVGTPPPVAPVPPPSSGGGFRFPWPAWVGVGLMVVGGVGTAAFAVAANGEESDLRATCAPGCDPSLQSSIDTKLVLANVSLGIGIAGLGLAVVATIVANVGHKEPAPATGLVVTPMPGGAALGWAGAF